MSLSTILHTVYVGQLRSCLRTRSWRFGVIRSFISSQISIEEQQFNMSKKVVLASYPKEGSLPTEDNFRVEDETLRPLQDGEVLLKTLYLSVDPYMRIRINPNISGYRGFHSKCSAFNCTHFPHRTVQIGDTMIGGGIGEVVDSKSDKFKKGDVAIAFTGTGTFIELVNSLFKGWRTHHIAKDTEIQKVHKEVYKFHVLMHSEV